MHPALDQLLAIFLTFLATGSIAATLLGLPGTWVMVLVAALLAWLPDHQLRIHLPVWNAMAVLALATLGEVIEFATGALGVGKLGGSRRSAALAVLGSLMGGFFGILIGVPIPLAGSLIASLAGAALGAGLGAVLGETWKGKKLPDSMKVGWAALWGRLIGAVGKSLCAALIAILMIFEWWLR
jgi:uncharacterized protein YqgC (DUF456 family)